MFNLHVQKQFNPLESVLDSDCEGNILTIRSINKKKKSCIIIWYGEGGNCFMRQYCLKNVPCGAVICKFRATLNFSNAIAILLPGRILQIHLSSGESFDISLPEPFRFLCPSTLGLLLCNGRNYESQSTVPSTDGLSPNAYYLSGPYSSLLPVVNSRTPTSRNTTTAQVEEVLAVKQSVTNVEIICTHISETSELFLYLLETSAPSKSPYMNHNSSTEVEDFNHTSDNRTDVSLLPENSMLISSSFDDDFLNATRSFIQNVNTRDQFGNHSFAFSGLLQTSNFGSQANVSMRSTSSGSIPNSTGISRFRTGSSGSRSGTPTEAILSIRRSSGSIAGSRESYTSPQQTLNPSPLQSLGLVGGSGQRGSSVSVPSITLTSKSETGSHGKLNEALQKLLGVTGGSLDSKVDIREKNKSPRLSAPSPLSHSGSTDALKATFSSSMQIGNSPTQQGLQMLPVATISLQQFEIDNSAIDVSFSGDFGQIGGLCMHIFVRSKGLYYGYSIQKSDSGSDISLVPKLLCSNDAKAVSIIDVNHLPVIAVTSIAHCSTFLNRRSHQKDVPYSDIYGDRNDSIVPITLLTFKPDINVVKESRHSAIVMIGCNVIGKTNLSEVEDDFTSDSDEEVEPIAADLPSDDEIIVVQTFDCSSAYFIVHNEMGTHRSTRVISFPSCLLKEKIHQAFEFRLLAMDEGDLKNSFGVSESELVSLIRSVISIAREWEADLAFTQAFSPVCCLLLGLIISAEIEIPQEFVVSLCVASLSGISVDLFIASSASNNIRISDELRELYDRLAAVSAGLSNYDAILKDGFATTVFSIYHNLIQDRILRYEIVDQDSTELLELTRPLRIAMNCLASAKQLGHTQASTLVNRYATTYIGQRAGSVGSNAVEVPFDSLQWYYSLLRGDRSVAFPQLSLTSCCPTLKLVKRFFEYIFDSAEKMSDEHSSRKIVGAVIFSLKTELTSINWETALLFFPSRLCVLLDYALQQCQHFPDESWPDVVLNSVGRNDLCRSNMAKYHTHYSFGTIQKQAPVISFKGSNDTDVVSDGLLEMEKASYFRFTEDDRLHEVCRMLRSSTSIYVKVEKSPEISELDHRHKLQMRLLTLCRRTLACSVGRGMVTMSTLEPLMAEVLPIPPLSLCGRVPPSNSVVTLDTTTAHADLTLWPEFHNGVAAALRIGPATVAAGSGEKPRSRVTRNWIIYNKTASHSNAGGEASHAGFLLGLGLQGHLSALSVTDICDYLTQGHEPTTISILIGVAASKISSADPLQSKTLCLHLPALLPPQHWDIEISPLVQTASLIGLGLLHCGSGHRLMTEFLLAELSRTVPTLHSSSHNNGNHLASDGCETRETIALAAAWSLGMVLLGKGNKSNDSGSNSDALRGLMDLRIEDRLEQFINGGRKPAESSLFPSSVNIGSTSAIDSASRSSRVMEGDIINTDVTAPGAAIALALIYIRSNDVDILTRLALPTTIILLDSIRPDMLLYRALGRCLVMWDSFTPSDSWLQSQIPSPITDALFAFLISCGVQMVGGEASQDRRKKESTTKIGKYFEERNSSSLSTRAAFPLYLSSVAGLCYGIGMVFAGTANLAAKDTIFKQLKFLQSLREVKATAKLGFVVDRRTKYAVESSISTVALALSCVMAGSGDLDCLRLLRELRWKVDDITYGSHLAISMAIGLLFLGGGTYSLKRDPISTASLLLAICPRFPSRTVDNQYHLQALRHLYVLATETRALHTVDVDTGLPVSLDVEVVRKDGSIENIVAPGLLPELSTITKIQLKHSSIGNNSRNMEYFPASMTLHSNEIHKDEHSLLEGLQRKYMQRQVSVPPLLVKRIPCRQGADATVGDNDKAPMSSKSDRWRLCFTTNSEKFDKLRGRWRHLELQEILQNKDQVELGSYYLANSDFRSIITEALAE